MNQEKTKQWTESYARQVLESAVNRGRSATQVAQEQGVKPNRVYYWRQRLGLNSRGGDAQKAGQFVEVKMAPRAEEQTMEASGRPFTVQMGNGVRIEVVAGFDQGELSRLLAVLEAL